MRLLIAESDPTLGRFLSTHLRGDGHQVEWAHDGQAAMLSFTEDTPDLVVMDLTLARKDGFEVLHAMRTAREEVPLLVLTAQHDVAVRIRCLEMGADDCMLKPFSVAELRARCKALLRRRGGAAAAILRHDGLELNRISRTVLRAGERIALTNKECALLEHLMLNRGRCVSRTALLECVWKAHASVTTNVVDVYINYLRRKLQDDGDVRLITTVRGEGYRFGSVSDADDGPRCGSGFEDAEAQAENW